MKSRLIVRKEGFVTIGKRITVWYSSQEIQCGKRKRRTRRVIAERSRFTLVESALAVSDQSSDIASAN
eukprot:2769452-Pleurochrysis_carterae.AAC.2